MAGKTYLVGIDVGGTFTDILCLNTVTQVFLESKVTSFNGSQCEGVFTAMGEL